jgi:hypothetical protein
MSETPAASTQILQKAKGYVSGFRLHPGSKLRLRIRLLEFGPGPLLRGLKSLHGIIMSSLGSLSGLFCQLEGGSSQAETIRGRTYRQITAFLNLLLPSFPQVPSLAPLHAFQTSREGEHGNRIDKKGQATKVPLKDKDTDKGQNDRCRNTDFRQCSKTEYLAVTLSTEMPVPKGLRVAPIALLSQGFRLCKTGLRLSDLLLFLFHDGHRLLNSHCRRLDLLHDLWELFIVRCRQACFDPFLNLTRQFPVFIPAPAAAGNNNVAITVFDTLGEEQIYGTDVTAHRYSNLTGVVRRALAAKVAETVSLRYIKRMLHAAHPMCAELLSQHLCLRDARFDVGCRLLQGFNIVTKPCVLFINLGGKQHVLQTLSNDRPEPPRLAHSLYVIRRRTRTAHPISLPVELAMGPTCVTA